MGQVIQFRIRPLIPNHAAALDPAEHVLLVGIRCWVHAYRGNEDPMPRLCQALEAAGSCDAALSIDALMAVIVRTDQRPVAIHGPSCPHLSDDERCLLHAASLVDDGCLAEAALRTAFLSSQGAKSALACLQGLCERFAEAGLFFRQRRLPVAHQPSNTSIEPWLPSTSPATFH
jgi:hypothetical protein